MTARLAAAAQDGDRPDVGISFTVGGLLFPYQLGAAKALYEAGVASPATPLSGASSGAIVAVVAALSETGSPTLDDSLEAALRVNGYCRDRGGMRGQYYDALSLEADRLLDGTSAARLSERPSPVSVAVTQFKPLPTPLLASSFTDQDDVKGAPGHVVHTVLLQGLEAICDVPRRAGRRRLLRGKTRWQLRGAINKRAADHPGLPVPRSDDRARGGRRHRAVDASLGSLLQCALGAPPVDDSYLEGLFARGAADAGLQVPLML